MYLDLALGCFFACYSCASSAAEAGESKRTDGQSSCSIFNFVIGYVHMLCVVLFDNIRRLILLTCSIWTEELIERFEILERADVCAHTRA
jgi:hypothetical protein